MECQCMGGQILNQLPYLCIFNLYARHMAFSLSCLNNYSLAVFYFYYQLSLHMIFLWGIRGHGIIMYS